MGKVLELVSFDYLNMNSPYNMSFGGNPFIDTDFDLSFLDQQSVFMINPISLSVDSSMFQPLCPPMNFQYFPPVTFTGGKYNTSSSTKSYSRSAYDEMIDKIARKEGVDPKLVKSVIKQESGFNPNAVSSCGARGLMQLMPATARELGVTNINDPEQNIRGGVKYLKQMLKRYNGDITLALAAYNAGPNNVSKYGGIPPFAETQNYVNKIMSSYLA